MMVMVRCFWKIHHPDACLVVVLVQIIISNQLLVQHFHLFYAMLFLHHFLKIPLMWVHRFPLLSKSEISIVSLLFADCMLFCVWHIFEHLSEILETLRLLSWSNLVLKQTYSATSATKGCWSRLICACFPLRCYEGWEWGDKKI